MELIAESAGASIALFIFAVAVVVAIFIDDDDLPGPRLCRVASLGHRS
jgi:hypothetical protein